MTTRNCPMCGSYMEKKPSAKWKARYECPNCDHWEYDHSAVREDYLERDHFVAEGRDLEQEFAPKSKV